MADLRERGLTFKEIGAELSVTKQCVQRSIAELRIVPKRALFCRSCKALSYRGKSILSRSQTVLCLKCLKTAPDADFSERLKAHRLARGMTQKSLADVSGVSASAIAKYESGAIINPAFISLRKLVKVLGAALVCD